VDATFLEQKAMTTQPRGPTMKLSKETLDARTIEKQRKGRSDFILFEQRRDSPRLVAGR